MKNEKKQQQVISKDNFFEKILNSKFLYILLAILVLIYLFQDDKILNLSFSFFWIRSLLAFCLITIFFLWRYNEHKVYYQRKFKDKVYISGLFLGALVFTLMLQGLICIPINFLIKQSATEQTEIFYCKITNVVTTNIDKIHFEFLGKRYSRYFNVNNYNRNDLIMNYNLKVEVKKSIWSTYYIDKMSLEKK